MLLLAIDTSTSAVAVALHDGQRVLAESSTIDARRHGELVAPAITAVLEQAGRAAADVTAVVAGVGPGPFTGLRVGLVTARTFAFARGVPVHGICSLDALARQAWVEDAPALGTSFLVATDAKRKEVYWARYDVTDAGPRRTEGPAVARPETVGDDEGHLVVVGRGALLYPGSFGPRVGPLDVSAGHLAAVAADALPDRPPLLAPEPLYLRRPDAAPPGARKPALS